MAKRVLVSWIGRSDYGAIDNADERDLGPVRRLLTELQDIDDVFLLNDIASFGPRKLTSNDYRQWLIEQLQRPSMEIHPIIDSGQSLRNKYGLAYEFTRENIQQIRRQCLSLDHQTQFAFLLTPGYPVCQVSMLISAASLFGYGEVELYNTLHYRDTEDNKALVEQVQLPFSIGVDFVNTFVRPDDVLRAVDNANEIDESFETIIGESYAMLATKHQAQKIAHRDVRQILILGENGTGKTQLAKAIHATSPTASGPFVAVNCGALSEQLIESELFGHVKGAFTDAHEDKTGKIEAANGGTLFLDEIGDAPLSLQVKLLKAIDEKTITPVGSTESRQVDFRLICATNQNLSLLISQRRFREDLYYRISMAPIRVPALSERTSDIPLLVERFRAEMASKYGDIPIEDEAIELLKRAAWPGNVRQLRNVVENAMWRCPQGEKMGTDYFAHLATNNSQPEQHKLSNLSPVELLNEFVAVTDQVTAAFKLGQLDFAGEGKLTDCFIEPILRGRLEKQPIVAPDVFDSLRQAYELVSKNTYYTTWSEAAKKYNEFLAPLIDEHAVAKRK